ncbi:C2 domain-containing protein [Dipodascopsis tothii]|uniref:C2 domain-containing protein n=1 Tax=Dipodascopsis tothii TaxID=44089 RepID=UPI0034CDCFD6
MNRPDGRPRRRLGMLIVILLKARNLALPAGAHPYCLAIVDGVVRRTAPEKDEPDAPTWDQEVRYEIFESSDRLMTCTVLHETAVGPAVIGRAELQLTPALQTTPDKGHDAWYPIKTDDRTCGEVFLEMTFYPDVSGKLAALTAARTP